MNIINIIITSSCARSARFATCARSSLQSSCLHALKVQLIVTVVYDSSHTAVMHDVVMKGVACYKDASDHDRILQWEQWCPCPRWWAARCDQLVDSIQVWRPVVESAWCELSPSPQEGWGLSLPGPVSSSTPPHQGVSLTPGGSLHLVQSYPFLLLFLITCTNSHAHAHYRKVQRLLPVSAHGEFLRHRKKVVSCLVVRSQDFRGE